MNGMLQIIQNDPEVPAGNILGNLSLPYRVLHPYLGEQLPQPEEITALIVLGGAMGANDDPKHPFLTELKQLIRQVAAAGIPYLGICLGGQLLAASLGAKVVSDRWEELGTLPITLTAEGQADRLFTGIEAGFTTFQWHHDSFDLPAGALLLAASPACPHQAFRVGSCAWGLQFHPEVTPGIIADWCAWDKATASRKETLLAEFAAKAAAYNSVARQLLHNFLKSAALV
jgi:GMP synthase-like glutamine amidotransferase